MLGKLDFCMLNPFCSTNVYGLATLNTPKEKFFILGLVLGPGVVGEEALDLVVRRDAARDVPEVGRKPNN